MCVSERVQFFRNQPPSLHILRHEDMTQNAKAKIALDHTSTVKLELMGEVNSPGAWDQSLI